MQEKGTGNHGKPAPGSEQAGLREGVSLLAR